eukprot:sb/3476320/
MIKSNGPQGPNPNSRAAFLSIPSLRGRAHEGIAAHSKEICESFQFSGSFSFREVLKSAQVTSFKLRRSIRNARKPKQSLKKFWDLNFVWNALQSPRLRRLIKGPVAYAKNFVFTKTFS